MYTENIKTKKKDRNEMVKAFNAAVLKVAYETIPREAKRNKRQYWTEELQHLEDQVSSAREKVEQDPPTENNIVLNQTTSEYKRYFNSAVRSNWIKRTEHLNLDKDGNILWKLARAMSDGKTASAPVVIEHNQKLVAYK